MSFDAGISSFAYTAFAPKKSAISGCSRGPRTSPVTNSASAFHRLSGAPRAYATLLQDVFHHFIPRLRGPRGFLNLHHFILIGANWKLRDFRLASLLENKRGQGQEVAATYSGSVTEVFHWLAASSSDAQGLLISVVRFGSEAALVFCNSYWKL
ncbi:MAG: hypothetical protein WAN12_17085 [Candidatus Acidiferrum sp.]